MLRKPDDKIQVPITCQDADEFGARWDREATVLSGVIRGIGKVDARWC
jgi:hypothetical protein